VAGRALRLFSATLLLSLAAMAGPAAAAPRAVRTIDVTIVNFLYSPDPVTIDPGDTIRWTNLDSAPHSSVSIQPGFATLTLAQGQSTTTLFARSGTFAYVCGIHGASMRGTIVVTGTPAETAVPSTGVVGHLVEAVYERARPDRLVAGQDGGTVLLYASAALALLAVVRFAWTLRGR
jgi:plastocyanin